MEIKQLNESVVWYLLRCIAKLFSLSLDIVVLVVLALPERRVVDPDPDDPDDPTTGEAPHFLDSTELDRPHEEETSDSSVSVEQESEVTS